MEKISVEKFKNLLTNKKISIATLASKTGIACETLHGWTDGSITIMPRSKAKSIAYVLGCSPSDFIADYRQEIVIEPTRTDIETSFRLIKDKDLFSLLERIGEYELMEAIIRVHLNDDLDDISLATLLCQLGYLKIKQGAYKKGLAYTQKAASYALKSEAGMQIAAECRLITTMALMYLLEIEQAKRYMEYSLDLFENVKDKIFWIKHYIIAGKLELLTGRPSAAHNCYIKAKRLCDLLPESSQRLYLEAQLTAVAGEAYLLENDVTRAKEQIALLKRQSTALDFKEGLFYAEYYEIWLLALTGYAVDSLERFSNLYFHYQHSSQHPYIFHFLGVIVFKANDMPDLVKEWSQEILSTAKTTMKASDRELWAVPTLLKKIAN